MEDFIRHKGADGTFLTETRASSPSFGGRAGCTLQVTSLGLTPQFQVSG